jgi:hypothetical protein
MKLFRWQLAKFSLVLIGTLMVSGCALFQGSVQEDGLTNFSTNLMTSYRMLSPDGVASSSLSSMAVAPVWSPYESKILVENTTYTVNDYPEVGQRTEWTYTLEDSDDNIWKVKAKTYYDNDDNIDKTEEEYFIKDDGNGTHGAEDSYVDDNGIEDSLYRKKFRTKFKDKSERRDHIEGDALTAEFRYALFDVDAELDYDELPVTEDYDVNTSGRWSSKVVFGHDAKKNYKWPWWGEKTDVTVEGERYYSSQGTVQTYLILENGSAEKVDWLLDDVTPPVKKGKKEKSDSKYLFEGVLKIRIDGSERTIKGKYYIKGKNQNYEILVENDQVTLL